MVKIVIFAVIFAITLVSQTASKNLPSFIEKCSVKDNFEECFIRSANAAIPHLIHGDKNSNFPSFDPLKINEVVFDHSASLKILFTDLSIYNLKDAKAVSAQIDTAAKTITYTIEIPKVNIEANYETNGKILLLPIEGKGLSHTELLNGKYNWVIEFNTMDFESNEPLQLVNSHVNYTVSDTVYNFENLFNGNKELGDQMNKFLNENNHELHREFSPIVSETVNTLSQAILKGLLGKHKFSDVFLP